MCRTNPTTDEGNSGRTNNNQANEEEEECNNPLSQTAKQAVEAHPKSHVEMAMKFCRLLSTTSSSSSDDDETAARCRSFIGTSNDRLIKMGRSLENLVDMYGGNVQEESDNTEDDTELAKNKAAKLEASLENLVDDVCLLMSPPGTLKVPRVPFGKTGLQMPIVTLGCMRFQQEWGPRIQHFNDGPIGGDVQDNLVRILKRAILDYGICHIETARFYGCSELQIGVALQQLMWTGQIQRSDFILQTKVPAAKDPAVFRGMLEDSFKALQVDYLDLFAFHGLNFDENLDDFILGNNKSESNPDGGETATNCYQVVQEYVQAGKIRHVGFSTHGSTSLIAKAIQTDKFDYLNLHYHYFGSYTASGDGRNDFERPGNLDCVRLASQRNMGIFIISPFDKGGKLYMPSRQLRDLCLPMEPVEFGSQWIWNHHDMHHHAASSNNDENNSKLQLHTYTVGAARPSDLDEPALAAFRFGNRHAETLQRVQTVVQRLDQQKVNVLGQVWVNTWWKGLTKARDLSAKNDDSNPNVHFIEHNQVIWMYNNLKTFGMYEFCKDRYGSLETNATKWDDNKSPVENIEARPKGAWGFVPGLPLGAKGSSSSNDDSDDYFQNDLVGVPPENRARIREAHEFVKKWLATKPKKDTGADDEKESTGNTEEPAVKIPKEWETAVDMRTWPDFPEQPSRAPQNSG